VGDQIPVTIGLEGDVTVVHLTGELDLAVKGALEAALAPLKGEVIIDLSDVTFMDSGAIGVLIAACTRLSADGGGLSVRRPHDVPRRSLEVLGLRDWIVD
jgi:anti-anti-sigma factor